MSIPPTLSHYRIIHPLGRGGMGEVYAADDTKLHRKVAIKVLSRALASDPRHRDRFKREAQAIAALNHPNIVTVYSVEEVDGYLFIVMELVQGQQLAELIPVGGLALDVWLKVAVAVCDAMVKAHSVGITHRDLKPANVMVDADGQVKVLDFGLAKVSETEGNGYAETRVDGTSLTGEGLIVGTVAYMSPEQAQGQRVDARSDVFSFGVMLHEMAAGSRPFRGDSAMAIISSILRDTPASITTIRPELPARLSDIVARALMKEPGRRYQTAAELRGDLATLKDDLDSGRGPAATVTQAPASQRVVAKRRLPVVPLFAALALVAAIAYWTKAQWSQASVAFVIAKADRLTASGRAQKAVISSDGRYVVHVKTDTDGSSIWVRQTRTSSDIQIVPPSDVAYTGLAFSPDSDYVYFTALRSDKSAVYRIPVLGGAAQELLDDVHESVTFSPDGRRFAFLRRTASGGANLMTASLTGDELQSVAASTSDQMMQYDARWSPDGKVILVNGLSNVGSPHSACFAVDVSTGQLIEVGGRWALIEGLAWLPDGRSFIAAAVSLDADATRRSQLWQVSYPEGKRRRITTDLGEYSNISVAGDGSTIAAIQFEVETALWVAPRTHPSGGTKILGDRTSAVGVSGIDWTPDGRVVFTSAASGSQQIWVANSDGSGARQLTTGGIFNRYPNVSADGTSVLYQQIGSGPPAIARIPLDEKAGPTIVAQGPSPLWPRSDPVRHAVYYTDTTPKGWAAFRVPIEGGSRTALSGQFFVVEDVSSDGTQLLGMVLNEDDPTPPSFGLMPAGGGAIRLLPDFDVSLATSSIPAAFGPVPDTIEYLVGVSPDSAGFSDQARLSGAAVWRLSLTPGSKPQQITHVPDGIFGWSWSPDGERLLLARGRIRSDVVLLSRK